MSFHDILNIIDRKSISIIYDLLKETFHNGNHIYTCGNGGSASNASHVVNDLSFCNGKDNPNRLKITSLCDNISSILALANDVNYDSIFSHQLIGKLKENDVVIGFSGSGNSMNVIEALTYANSINAHSVAIVSYDGGKMAIIAKHVLHVPTFDMQKAEDGQMLLFHMMMQLFSIETGGEKK
jgi:D-sedoheptulose 7-phosphate isomerase